MGCSVVEKNVVVTTAVAQARAAATARQEEAEAFPVEDLERLVALHKAAEEVRFVTRMEI